MYLKISLTKVFRALIQYCIKTHNHLQIFFNELFLVSLFPFLTFSKRIQAEWRATEGVITFVKVRLQFFIYFLINTVNVLKNKGVWILSVATVHWFVRFLYQYNYANFSIN